MKRYLVLVLMLMVGVAAIVGSNAAYSTSVTLDDINIELVPPTTEPTPDPREWTGEFELVIRVTSIWGEQNPGQIHTNLTFNFINHTGSNNLPPVELHKIVVGVNMNWDVARGGHGEGVLADKLQDNKYILSFSRYNTGYSTPVKPGESSGEKYGAASTYPLTTSVDGVKTRTTYPDVNEMEFSSFSLSIATSHADVLADKMIELAPNQIKITYAEVPIYNEVWKNSVYFPPNWAPVH